jgi:UDPglucose 6-dehydrogenase
MKVAVCGLWHLGMVTAACLAAAGHEVTAYDPEWKGKPPVYEPGLDDLVQRGVSEGKIRFVAYPQDALSNAELVWICWDTPVDDNDVADVESVREKIRQLFPYLPDGCTVAISSQLPVGSTTAIEREFHANDPRNNRVPHPGGPSDISFAYVPENLRLGNAIECFNNPNQIIVGRKNNRDFGRVYDALFALPKVGKVGNIGSEPRILAMSPESAEMCKHAINAFLATQIALTNEIAVICEKVGADARDVEAALRSEPRIGPKAYVKAGAAFAGGTLARDLNYLDNMGSDLTMCVSHCNEEHKTWSYRQVTHRLASIIDGLKGKTIAVWGTAYKSGTDTLRRSATVEMIERIRCYGATVNVGDLVDPQFLLTISNADALIIGNEHPTYRQFLPEDFIRHMRRPLIIDPSGWLNITDPRIEYVVVGRSATHGKA